MYVYIHPMASVFFKVIKKSTLPVKYYLLHVQPKLLRLLEQEIPGVCFTKLLTGLALTISS